jgi:hypothetical protein
MFLRLIKAIVVNEQNIEKLRELLFNHQTFNVADAFKELDSGNDGSINA